MRIITPADHATYKTVCPECIGRCDMATAGKNFHSGAHVRRPDSVDHHSSQLTTIKLKKVIGAAGTADLFCGRGRRENFIF